MDQAASAKLAHNVTRLGHLDLQGAGQVLVQGNYAYIGHITNKEGLATSIVDVADPKNPKVMCQMPVGDSVSHSHKARVVGDLMITNMEQNMTAIGRKADELPKLRSVLQAELGRAPTDAELAAKLGVMASISLRVNPDVDAKTHPYISTGLKNNKFGIAFDSAMNVYRRAAALPHIRVVGVDCHIGSQLTDDAPLREAMGRIVALADALAKEGITVHHICPGGGVGITYQDEGTIDMDDYARALGASLGDRVVELLLEPGRMLVGNAGVLLSRVEYVKPTESKNFLVIDAAMNDLIRPALYQAHHEVVMVDQRRTDATEAIYDVVGPVCESADVLAHARALSAHEGDIVALLSAGAYGFVMSSNYNSRPRAAEVMIDGDDVTLIRERETFDDLVRLERPQTSQTNID